MFEKLLSQVPYNPGLAHHLAFYGRRMHQEASIRRLGVVFIALAFIVQSIAVLSPPQSAVASSNNDLINGGFSTPAEAYNKCMSNDSDNFGSIVHYFGIKCEDLKNASTSTLKPTAVRDGQHYYSAGRINYGSTDDKSYPIPGADTIYFRSFSSVTQDHNDDWRALMVHNNAGEQFYILYKCGNLVSIGLPSPSPLVEETKSAPSKPAPIPVPASTPALAPVTPTPKTTPPCQYNAALPADSPQCKAPCPYNSSITLDSSLCYPPCQYNGSISAGDSQCKPCDKSTSQNDAVACVSVRKTATNVTQSIADANNTTANAGDVIIYTLYAQNNGKAMIEDFTFQENLSDVLDYATVTDPHGGNLVTTDNVIAWPSQNIAPGATASVQVTVQVKNPIPQTPVSSSDPSHFDLIMTNVYGNAVNIKLPPSPTKAIETASAKLPNTGPGTTLFIAALVVFIAGYFYSRASLLAKESDIAVKEPY